MVLKALSTLESGTGANLNIITCTIIQCPLTCEVVSGVSIINDFGPHSRAPTQTH